MYQKIQLGFSSKIEVPSSARLGSETFQLSSAQLGKFQLELITKDYELGASNYGFNLNILCMYFFKHNENLHLLKSHLK